MKRSRFPVVAAACLLAVAAVLTAGCTRKEFMDEVTPPGTVAPAPEGRAIHEEQARTEGAGRETTEMETIQPGSGTAGRTYRATDRGYEPVDR